MKRVTRAIDLLPVSIARPDLLPADEAARVLGTDPERGLGPALAADRLARLGPNELPPPPRVGWPARLLRQLIEPMALLLIGAAAVSALALGDRVGAVAILAIVALNAMIALFQEGTAGRALDALRRLETPRARVVRGGAPGVIPARDLVPGDVVLFAAGDRVPADLRLIEAAALEADESLLTGESLPVAKDPAAIGKADAALAERPAMLFAGTLLTRGSARAIVALTGADTALGAIARGLRARPVPTPLQRELGRLTARLGAISIAIAAAVFAVSALRMGGAEGLERAFLVAVALAVAAVPEGLATVTTVALALGVRRMAAHGSIVRRLPAVETLGSTTVLAIDKTGTLTENRLALESAAPARCASRPVSDLPEAIRVPLVEAAVLCNDATITPPAGDPLDLALLAFAGAERIDPLREARPRLAALPFDAVRKRMTTLHRMPGGALLIVKGAPERVVALCADALDATGGRVPLDDDARRALLATADRMAAGGARVLALARRDFPGPPADLEAAERGSTLLALIGMRDPVRPEAASSVARIRAAGIRLIMVSGDHPGTCAAIARETGLAGPEAALLTGDDLRARGMPPDPLAVTVYARVDPEQKLALVEALQARGEVVAMTGDGVNDAPALRRADIGVAMGRRGSDVAREAGDMIVTDDNLATIATAVLEGRGIYDNIRKVVDYLVAGNLSEILVVLGGLFLFPEMGVPLLPLQLLWINLLTDGLPAIALGADAVHEGLMDHPPRRADERLLGARRVARLLGRGLLIAGVSIGSLALARFLWHEPWAHARWLMFTVLVTAHLLYAFAARIPTRAKLRDMVPNAWLVLAVGFGLGLQFLIAAWPAAHGLFGATALGPREWGLALVAGVIPALIIAAERSAAGADRKYLARTD